MKVTYHVDQPALQRAIEVEVAEHQEMFIDDLQRPFREAARDVIFGNFMGSGAYSPRPIGKFSNTRAEYLRGWVESNYRSQRDYLAQLGGGKGDGFDHLRTGMISDAAKSAGKPGLSAGGLPGNPLARLPGQGHANLRRELSRGEGKHLTRKIPAHTGKMRYGVQTGKLAKAWYDLSVGVSLSQKGLVINLHPARVAQKGTPDAERLTEYLSRNRGWRGLMDEPQLKQALDEQGVRSV